MPDKFVFHINEECPRPQGVNQTNRVIFSSFRRFETEMESKGFSIKIPLEGKETYIVDNRDYTVKHGEFFVVNDRQTVGYDLNHRQAIKGLCVYLDHRLIKEAHTAFVMSDEDQLDEPEGVQAFEMPVGRYLFEEGRLRQLISCLVSSTTVELSMFDIDSFFHDMAFELAAQGEIHRPRIDALNIRKKSTKEEIYLRLQMARQFMHDECHQPLCVRDIANIASLSEFHFIRCFKSCFGLSPYQYLLKIRVDKAKELLKMNHGNITEIAADTGFTDVFMFSKVFKKQTGVSPVLFNKMRQSA